MKRPEQVNNERGSPGVFADQKWREKYPTVCQYLADDVWEDGKPREVSKIAVTSQDGLVLVMLNDGELRRSLYVTGDTVEKALAALERQLIAAGADWRAWGGNKKKK